MDQELFVTTDAVGVEHGDEGDIAWALPASGKSTLSPVGQSLTLRSADGLLDVLDQAIFRAEPTGSDSVDSNATVRVTAARLIEETPWNTDAATRFALDCAEHALGETTDVQLPDGTPISAVIADARRFLDGVSSDAEERLGYLSRIRALRRLRREHGEIGELASAVVADDERRDLDIMEDPAYATLAPLSDAVLAAIEALRHHVLPRFFTDAEDDQLISTEREGLSAESPMTVPSVTMTPWGPIAFGGQHILSYEPSWTSARKAALHARRAVEERDGKEGVTGERRWQASRLGEILKVSSNP